MISLEEPLRKQEMIRRKILMKLRTSLYLKYENKLKEFNRSISSRFKLNFGDCFVSPVEFLEVLEFNKAEFGDKQGADAQYDVEL